jgi:hypothetical protein
VWLGVVMNLIAAASAGVAGVRARPPRIVSTRASKLAVPTSVISEAANWASSRSALGLAKSNWRAKFNRSFKSTASTAVAPGMVVVRQRLASV